MSRGAGGAGAWCGKGESRGAGGGDVGGFSRDPDGFGLVSKVGSGFAGRAWGIRTGEGTLTEWLVRRTGQSAPVELRFIYLNNF